MVFVYNNDNILKEFKENCDFIKGKTNEALENPSPENNVIFMPNLLEFFNS